MEQCIFGSYDYYANASELAKQLFHVQIERKVVYVPIHLKRF